MIKKLICKLFHKDYFKFIGYTAVDFTGGHYEYKCEKCGTFHSLISQLKLNK